MEFVVYPYKMGSAAGKLLAGALEAKRVYPDRDYAPKTGDVIVNFGNGNTPIWYGQAKGKVVVNHWSHVCNAINKLTSFQLFDQAKVRFPATTKEPRTAMGWIGDGRIVFGRETAEGTRGQGIHVMKSPRDFVDCRFYTQCIKPTAEYRVYVFGDRYLDGLEKRRTLEAIEKGTVDPFVRTEETGWIFCRERVKVPDDCIVQSIQAVKALGLQFGGVDVVWNKEEGKGYVLEVNSAPGIYGKTVSLIAQEIKQYAEANS